MPIIHTTRLAPSPTGALHLGNAKTFLLNWLIARQNGWQIALRIEDLDSPRVKVGADSQAINDIKWIGLDWDAGPIYQSTRLALYKTAIEDLVSRGHAYACICTRTDIENVASAPNAGDHSVVYPGTCRGRFPSIEAAAAAAGRPPAIRFRVPDECRDEFIEWNDWIAGTVKYSVSMLGDFVIAKADGTPAYQLAVVVDDLEMNIDRIIRGDDLLESTARQILLMDAMNVSQSRRPTYGHNTLVTGTDGRRLAKRHGDSRLARFCQMGVPPQAILRLLACWCGYNAAPPDGTVPDQLRWMLDHFSLPQIPRVANVFTRDDEHELLCSKKT